MRFPAQSTSIANIDPWINLDGRLNAPSGPAQYPALLNNYHPGGTANARYFLGAGGGYQPPWHVAGVDYAVGPRAAPSLDPAVSPPAGCTYSATGASNGTPQIRVIADNVTISGYDLTLHGGVSISCPLNSGLAIKDNKIGGANLPGLSTGPIDFRGTGLTIAYNIVDGGSIGGAENQACLIFINPPSNSGSVVFQYNWFKNYCQQVVEFLQSVTLDYRFNVIDDTTEETGGHQNWLQWGGGTASSPVVAFNTSRQVTLGGAEGFQFYFNNTGTMASPSLTNNTLIALKNGGTNTMSNMVHGSGLGTGTTTLTGNPVNSTNYFDRSGATAAYYPGSFGGWASSGNLDMNTGATIIPA